MLVLRAPSSALQIIRISIEPNPLLFPLINQCKWHCFVTVILMTQIEINILIAWREKQCFYSIHFQLYVDGCVCSLFGCSWLDWAFFFILSSKLFETLFDLINGISLLIFFTVQYSKMSVYSLNVRHTLGLPLTRTKVLKI